MRDPISKLRSATRRAKSDVANKLVSMCLHEMSRRISEGWDIKVDGQTYGNLVREHFGNKCPYCTRDLSEADSVIEHLDGMNRLRAGLHVPGNVLVACKRCNSEKRRDDSLGVLVLARTGWESFLSHDGEHCDKPCGTCRYWETVWPNGVERKMRLGESLQKIRSFRSSFPDFQQTLPTLMKTQPAMLSKLYVDCQSFAEREINVLLERFVSDTDLRT
jgi:hypothetical protein